MTQKQKKEKIFLPHPEAYFRAARIIQFTFLLAVPDKNQNISPVSSALTLVPIQTTKRSPRNLWGLHIGIFHEEIATGCMEVNALGIGIKAINWPLVGKTTCSPFGFCELMVATPPKKTQKNRYKEGMVDDRFIQQFPSSPLSLPYDQPFTQPLAD